MCRLSWSIFSNLGENSPEMCVAARNRDKFTKNPYFSGLRSFKVVDVGTTEKLVSSACYDKQQVCVYLQTFS